MTTDLTEQEQLTLIAALKVASTQYYREAWEVSGPMGRAPNEQAHHALMAMGDRTCALGRKFGDPMD
jgi:hypothetical protein